MITLRPVAMVRPSREGIYAPSHIRKPRQISRAEFMSRYADHPVAIPVSFAPDGVSDPQITTAYSFGLDCWWIADECLVP